ncbi:MAG: peptidylprolyl isomerase, partial [Chitinophagaceae bacterium]
MDVEILTDKGRMVARLSDSTPLHRDNFIRLVKAHFYDGISFHRVINGFMVQGGDPATKNPKDTIDKS